MAKQSIINNDGSKTNTGNTLDVSSLKDAVNVSKLISDTPRNLLIKTSVGDVNKYDRNLAVAQNDPMGRLTKEQNRLANQPTSEAFINAGIQAASEIGLGTLEGAGFLLDLPQWVNTIKGTERDFSNWFSDSINELKKEVAEDNPIYAIDGYHPTNAKWWASMIPSIATTASLVFPSMAGAKLMSTVGKLSTKLAKGISSGTKSANLLAKGLEKSGSALQNYTGVSAAIFSRMAEGTLEATEAGTQAYQKYMQEGMSMEEATQKAGEASAATFLGNMPLLALDLLQYNTIFKQFGTKVGIQAAENALNLSTKSVARRTLKKAWDTVKTPLGEGLEEGLQFGVKEESIKMAQEGMPDNRIEILMKQYSDIAKNVLPEYFDNDEFLTSITLGAVGGKVFETITPAIRRLAKLDNTIDEDLRSGKIVAPYYKTRKAFADLLQQDEVKANEMLEAAKTDPKLNKLGEAESFENILKDYNELKNDPTIINNVNSDLLIKESLNESIYNDLKKQLENKSIELPEGIDVTDLKIDALSQLESYELQTPNVNLRNLQEIRKRKNDLIAKKTNTELESGVKTTYKPKEGYSWGSRTHRAAINHHANIELADILGSIANQKFIAYQSENGSMYGNLDRKIQERLDKIEDLEVLRGSEEFDTDEKYLNFLESVKFDRPDLTDEVNLIFDKIYKENIYDENHPINKKAKDLVEVDGKQNKMFSIYQANSASASITKDDASKLRFRNLFSNGIASTNLVVADKLKYNITPKIGTVVKFNDKPYILYNIVEDRAYFISLDSEDKIDLEVSKIKPTDVEETYRTVKDLETGKSIIMLPNKGIVVGEGISVYERNDVENIIKHDMLTEISNPEVFKIEEQRRNELEKADIKIPSIKTIGPVVSISPFTLGNKSKASRKEAARKLGIKNKELVKLSYYEEGSKTLHAIPFMLVNGELIDTSNNFYDPEFDKRVFVKAQKFENQIDINNKVYNEINNRYNNKYLGLLDKGVLTVQQVNNLLYRKNPSTEFLKELNSIINLKYRIRSQEDINSILETIENKGFIIKKRGEKSINDNSIIDNGFYEIDGVLHHSTTSLKDELNPPYTGPKTDKYINRGNTIDTLSRDIFSSDTLDRASLVKSYKDLFANEEVLNEAITLIAKRKQSLEKEGFKFIAKGVILFSKESNKNIAGETDLIAYDNLGNVHIMDVKTFSPDTYKKFNSESDSTVNLSKKDGYRTQLSAYADMFEKRTNFKVSGISIIPYVLESDDKGVISSITSKNKINLEVISKLNPLDFRNNIYNSAFEVLKVTDKTDAIINDSNVEKVITGMISHLYSTIIKPVNTKKFAITDLIVYYNKIIDLYENYKPLLSKKEGSINKMKSIVEELKHYNNLKDHPNLDVLLGTPINTVISEAINSESVIFHYKSSSKKFATIIKDKVYFLKEQYLKLKVGKDIDDTNDLFIIKSGNDYYKADQEILDEFISKTEEATGKSIDTLNVDSDTIKEAIKFGFEKIEDDLVIDSEMYSAYSIQTLKDGELDFISFNQTDVQNAKDNDLPIDSHIKSEIIEEKFRAVVAEDIDIKLADIAKTLTALESLDTQTLTIEKLQSYILDEDELKLLDTSEKLLEFYNDKVNALRQQSEYYKELIDKNDGTISEEVINSELITVNNQISFLESVINKLKELINAILDLIDKQSKEKNLQNKQELLKQKRNIKLFLTELKELLKEVETPAATEEDVIELQNVGKVVKGVSAKNNLSETKGKFRKVRSNYIGKFIYVTNDLNVDEFINAVGSEDIIYLDKVKDAKAILSDIGDRIVITSNPDYVKLVDSIIVYPNTKSKNKNYNVRETKLIYDNIISTKPDVDFIDKIKFVNEGTKLMSVLTEGINNITDEDITNAESKYQFQHSGLIDNDITYDPFKDITLTVRGDYDNTATIDESDSDEKYYYPRIVNNDFTEKLNNVISDLFDNGVKTLEGDTVTYVNNDLREDFENLYKNKKDEDLFKKNTSVLVYKSQDGNIEIILAYKDTSNNEIKYIPTGIVNTVEQAVKAYYIDSKKSNESEIVLARKNVILTNLIRNEISELAKDIQVGQLTEVDYNKIIFNDARTTGLNIDYDNNGEPMYSPLSEKLDPNKDIELFVVSKDSIYTFGKKLKEDDKLVIDTVYRKNVTDKFLVLYKTYDKLGKSVILPGTLKRYKDTPADLQKEIKSLVDQIADLKQVIGTDGQYVNITKIKELFKELNSITFTNYKEETINDFLKSFTNYNDFHNNYNKSNFNLVIDYDKIVNSREYNKYLTENFIITDINKDPYVNIQYIYNLNNDIFDKNNSYDILEEDDLITKGLFFDKTDRVNTNRYLKLDENVTIKKPMNFQSLYRKEFNDATPQFVNEIVNKFDNTLSYTESFNELLKALNSKEDLDIDKVIRHIFSNNNSKFLKELLKPYLTLQDLIVDYVTNPDSLPQLRNYINNFNIFLNDNKKFINNFHNNIDDAYFLDHAPEMEIENIRLASRALISLAIQSNKIDFNNPNTLIDIVNGSNETNFFLNELVLLLLEKSNAKNLPTVVKLIKALRPDIEAIEIADDNNEFILVKNNKKSNNGKLYLSILESLKDFGYEFKVKEESLAYDEEETYNIEESTNSVESWSVVKSFMFPTTNLAKNTKILLQSIISPELDELGLGINLNYKLNNAYAITIDKLVNSTSREDLINKVNEYADSIEYIRRLKNYINSRTNMDELYGELYSSIGNKVRVSYNTVVKDKSDNIYPTLSNRQSFENIITQALNTGVKADTVITFDNIIELLPLNSKETAEVKANSIIKNDINTLLDRYNKARVLYKNLDEDKQADFTFDTRNYLETKTSLYPSTINLIKKISKHLPKSSNAAHMTVEKTMQYQDTTGNFISYIQNNTEKHYRELREANFENLPVLNRPEKFEVIQVIGYDDQKSNRGVTVSKFDKKTTAEVLLSMHTKTSYPAPVPGDSGNLVFVKGVIPDKSENSNFDITKELVKLYQFEKERIESENNRGVKHYKNKYKEFIIFKEIDKIIKDKSLDDSITSDIEKAFDIYFETATDEFINYLTSLGIVDNRGILSSKIQGYTQLYTKLNASKETKSKAVTAAKNKFKNEITNFLKNYTAAYVNISLVTIGDPAYYKSIEDIFKRAKGYLSPGEDMDMAQVYTNPKNTSDVVSLKNKRMRLAIINDIDSFFTKEDEYDQIGEALDSINKGEVITQFDDTSWTDGVSYVDPIAYRDRMVGLHEWDHSQQEIMDDIMLGKSVVSYNKENSKVSTDSKFTTIKPFYFYHGPNIERDLYGNNINEPFLKKDSEFFVTPYYGLKKVKNDNGEFVDNPMYNRFFRNILSKIFGYTFDDVNHTVSYDKNNRVGDTVSFNSAIKVGESNTIKDIETQDSFDVVDLDFRFWKKQNETPKGHFGKESIFGTQIMKEITADFSEDATFEVNGVSYTRDTLIREYDQLIIDDVKRSFEELKAKYSNSEELIKILQEESKDGTINLQKALEYLIDLDGNIDPNIPLAHPLITNRIQPKLNAIYKNKVTTRKFKKGFKAANAPSYGFTNKQPRIVWNTDETGTENPALGIKHFEVLAPIHDMVIYDYLDKSSGIVDMEALKRDYPELLEGLLYRIPTEDKYSMFKVQIIGFLPNEDGAIIMPSMVTKIAGLDFDIDKMYGFFKNPTMSEEDFLKRYINDIVRESNILLKEIELNNGKDTNKWSDEVTKRYNDIKLTRNNTINSIRTKGTKENIDFVNEYNSFKKIDESDNNKLDIMRAILSHPESLKAQIIPGGFKIVEDEVLNIRFYDMLDENLKFPDNNVSEEIFLSKTNSDKLSVLDTNSRSFINPTLWIDTVEAMNVGKDMTGIAANHNAARAILQRSNIKFNDRLKVEYNGVNKDIDFSDIYDFNGDVTIIGSIRIILAAVLDNGKNPLISYFGLNPKNANISLAGIHLGLPLDNVMYLQKAFTNMLDNAIHNPDELKSILNSEVSNPDNVSLVINADDILHYIKHKAFIKAGKKDSDGRLKAIERQLYINYSILKELGDEINDIVTYTQRGNRGGKPTFFENHIDILQYNTYLNDETDSKYFDKDSINNYFNNDEIFITTFNKFISEQNSEVVRLLQLPNFFNNESESFTSLRGLVEKDFLLKYKDSKVLNRIYNALYYKATVESQSSYFLPKKKFIENNFTKEWFDDIKSKYKENNFIRSLGLDKDYEGEGIKITINSVDFKDRDAQDIVIQGWKKLIISNKKSEREIGELLAVYSIITTGYDVSRNSFNHLIPIEFYTNTLKDYTSRLNTEIEKLTSDVTTGINLFTMIVNKYGKPEGLNDKNVTLSFDNSVLNLAVNDIRLLENRTINPLYYNIFNTEINRVNTINLLAKEMIDDSDINNIGSELNKDVKDRISKLIELKDYIAKSDNIPLNDIFENVFSLVDVDDFNTWFDSNSEKYIKLINDNEEFKQRMASTSNKDEASAILTLIVMPFYIDDLIARLKSNEEKSNYAKNEKIDLETFLKSTGLKANQKKAVRGIVKEYNKDNKDRQPVLILGKAGTGKTYMLGQTLKFITRNLEPNTKLNIVGSALANSAKNNLQESLNNQDVKTTNNVTVRYHSVASLLNNVESRLSSGKKSNNSNSKLKLTYKDVFTILIVDEMSMLSQSDFKKIQNDTINGKFLVIYAGDHGQLPSPNKSEDNTVFNILNEFSKDNTYSLTEAVRQKPDSPILPYLDPLWDNATKTKASEVIAVPNLLNKDGGIISMSNSEANIKNISKLYKKAIDDKNLNYVQYVTYSNPNVDKFNKQIREELYPDSKEDYKAGEFIIFYSGYRDNIDNGTKARILGKVDINSYELLDVVQRPSTSIKDLNGKTIDFKDYVNYYEIEYKKDGVLVKEIIPLLDVKQNLELDNLIKKISFLTFYKPEDKSKVESKGNTPYNFGQKNVYDPTTKKVSSQKQNDDKLSEFVQFFDSFPYAKHAYATTIHKSQGMTNDITIFDKNSVDKRTNFDNSVEGKKQFELETFKLKYTAASRPKHLLLVIEDNGFDLSSENFIEINENIAKGIQEEIQYKKPDTSTEKKSTTKKETSTDNKSLSKNKFSSLYVTKYPVNDLESNYELKDENKTVVKLTKYKITNDTKKEKIKVGQIEYSHDNFFKAAGYNTKIDFIATQLKKSKPELYVYGLKEVTSKSTSKTSTIKSSIKPDKVVKKETKDTGKKENAPIDYTKVIYIRGLKINAIPFRKDDNRLYVISEDFTNLYDIPLSESYTVLNDKTVNFNEIDSFDTVYINYNNKIATIMNNDITIYPEFNKLGNIDKRYKAIFDKHSKCK